MREPLGIAAAVCLAVLLGGCASTSMSVQPDPQGWPDAWRGRRLYHTNNAYVYAGSKDAAVEADRTAREVGEDFRELTGREPTKGLWIVTDVGEPVVADDVVLINLAHQRDWLQRKGDPEDISAAEARRRLQDRAETKGVAVEDILALSTTGLRAGQVSELVDFPTDAVDPPVWGVVLSSRARLSKALMRSARAALAKKDAATRTVGTSMLAIHEPKMVDGLMIARKTVIYVLHCRAQPDWDREEAVRRLRVYVDRKIRPLIPASLPARRRVRSEEG